jgi:hypothetical protein
MQKAGVSGNEVNPFEESLICRNLITQCLLPSVFSILAEVLPVLIKGSTARNQLSRVRTIPDFRTVWRAIEIEGMNGGCSPILSQRWRTGSPV